MDIRTLQGNDYVELLGYANQLSTIDDKISHISFSCRDSTV